MRLLGLLSKYARSLQGGEPSAHTVRQAVQLVIGAVFAGYTVTAFPPQFLKLFEKPVMQFFVFLVLFNQNYWSGSKGFPRWYVLLDALLFTAVIQTAIYFAKKYYAEQNNELDNEEPIELPDEDMEEELPRVEVVPKEPEQAQQAQQAQQGNGENDYELIIVHGASWCGWSKKQMEEFETIKGQLQNNNVSVRAVEDKSDEGKMFSQQFKISGYPASLLFNNKQLVKTISGYRPTDVLVKEVVGLTKPTEGFSDGGLQLIIVHASSWCGWSKKQMEEYSAIKSELESKGVSCKEVEDSSDEGQQLSRQYDIDGYPGSLILKNGQLVDKVPGYKPKDALVQLVLKHQ